MPPALVGVIKVFPRVVEASARMMEKADVGAMARSAADLLRASRLLPRIRLELDGDEVVSGEWRGDSLDVTIQNHSPLRSLLLPAALKLNDVIRLGVDEPIEILSLFEIFQPLFLALSRELEALGITAQLNYGDLVLARVGWAASPVLSERYGRTEIFLSHIFKLLSDLFG